MQTIRILYFERKVGLAVYLLELNGFTKTWRLLVTAGCAYTISNIQAWHSEGASVDGRGLPDTR